MAVKSVYADCAASCPPLPCAQTAFEKATYGNPNSVHHMGRNSRALLEEARSVIARCINASPEQIAFTPSATAACHRAMERCRVISMSRFEHKAVASYIGHCHNEHGLAYMLANNETGERYDSEVRLMAQSERPVFTDATAAVGQIPVDVRWLGVHALAAGAHKFGGFPGVGFVYVHSGVTDESTYPGTPPVALAVAMASALEYRELHMAKARTYLAEQTERLAKAILDIPGAHINTPMDRRIPNILSVRFDGVNARELLTMLDVNGVYASAGSACTADSDEPSRVLLASGLTEEEALSTIRLSFCPETTPEQFIFVADATRRCVTQLRSLTK